MPIRIFVVDVQAVVRSGLALAFASSADMEVVGEATSLVRSSGEIVASQASVLVADFQPTSNQQVEILRQLQQALPGLRVLSFTAIDTPEMAQSLLDCGIHGYITKDASLDEVLVAVRALHAGRIFFSHTHTAIAPPSLYRAHSESTAATAKLSPSSSVSEREREVILMLADGLTNKEVAKNLFLSIKTVETYRSRVMKKFQLHGRAELFSFAKRLATTSSL